MVMDKYFLLCSGNYNRKETDCVFQPMTALKAWAHTVHSDTWLAMQSWQIRRKHQWPAVNILLPSRHTAGMEAIWDLMARQFYEENGFCSGRAKSRLLIELSGLKVLCHFPVGLSWIQAGQWSGRRFQQDQCPHGKCLYQKVDQKCRPIFNTSWKCSSPTRQFFLTALKTKRSSLLENFLPSVFSHDSLFRFSDPSGYMNVFSQLYTFVCLPSLDSFVVLKKFAGCEEVCEIETFLYLPWWVFKVCWFFTLNSKCLSFLCDISGMYDDMWWAIWGHPCLCSDVVSDPIIYWVWHILSESSQQVLNSHILPLLN